MGLFQGSGTAYGSGYDLERVPTRIEGLVLFLRLIGEEKAALAYGGENPFTDVPAWGGPMWPTPTPRGTPRGWTRA